MTLLTSKTWANNNSPAISFSTYYESYRSGASMFYRLQIVVGTCSGSSYFGYNIYDTMNLNGSQIHADMVKNSSPSQWTTAYTHTTGWVEVPNKTSGTTSASFRLYSTNGSRDETLTYDLPIVAVTAPTNITIFSVTPDPMEDDKSASLSWSGATAGSGSIDYYHVYARKHNGTSWGSYVFVAQVNGTSYSHNVKGTFSDLKAGDQVQYLVYTHDTVGGFSTGVECGQILDIIASATVRVKVSGTWYSGVPYVKVSGIWKKGVLYTNVSGTWKQGK